MTARQALDPLGLFRLAVERREPTDDERRRAAALTAKDVEALMAYSNGSAGRPGELLDLLDRAVDLGRIDRLWSKYAHCLLDDPDQPQPTARKGTTRKARA